MAVSKTQKVEILESLTNEIKEANAFAFTTNTALTVAEVTSLRKKLRAENAKFIIAKKTLIKKAVKEIHGIDIEDSYMQGQIGVLVAKWDAVASFGLVNTEMKKLKTKMTWSACYFEGELKDAKATAEIAGLPSRETLLSRLVGSMMSPLSGLARFFDGAAKEMTTKGVDTLWKLEGATPKTLEETKEEKPVEKVEEVKAEEETPAETTAE